MNDQDFVSKAEEHYCKGKIPQAPEGYRTLVVATKQDPDTLITLTFRRMFIWNEKLHVYSNVEPYCLLKIDVEDIALMDMR